MMMGADFTVRARLLFVLMLRILYLTPQRQPFWLGRALILFISLYEP